MTTTEPKIEDQKMAIPADAEVASVHKAANEDALELDEAEVFLRDHGFTHEYLQELLCDEARIRKVMRKVDWLILPLLAGTYMLQYLDKQALTYTAVFDLFTNTGINQDQYAWFASAFYLAYLVAEYPWSFLAQRTRMGKVVACCVTAWGAVLMISAAAHDFAGLMVCRFILGVFEAPVTICFVMIIGMWYTREEQPFRAGIFYCCNGFGSMIGGILTYAVGLEHTFPIWKAIFLLCGGLTVVWGVINILFLPDSILSTRRFTVEEKAILIARGKVGRTGILSHKIKVSQIIEALIDPQIWLLAFYMLLNEIINGGVANFGKLIIKGVVGDPLNTVLLGIPQGAFQVVWILTGTYFASRFRDSRTIIMMVYLIPTIIGISLMWQLDRVTWSHKVGVLMAYYTCGSFVASLVIAVQMPASNLSGYTKRMTGTAMVFMAYCVGNIIGPHAFLDQEAPTYPTGCKVQIACAVGQVATAVALRMLLIWRNKKRDAAMGATPALQDPIAYDSGADLTDFENQNFRYVL